MSGSLVDDTRRVHGGALVVSIAFHLAIFYAYSQMKFPGPRPYEGVGIESSLRIYVELIAPRTISNAPLFPVADPIPAVENSEKPVAIAEKFSEPDVVAIPVIPETTGSLLSSDDPQAIEIGTDSWITPDTGPQAGTFGSVFDPRLRQRLQHNHMHRSTARLDGPTETRDAYGDRRVTLNNERCMMARQSMRPGETTDWYLTSCVGLDEGEKMLRRVEQNWRNRGE